MTKNSKDAAGWYDFAVEDEEINVKPESIEAQNSGAIVQLGNSYEYDCELREYSDVANKQWYEGLPEFLEKRSAERRLAKAE